MSDKDTSHCFACNNDIPAQAAFCPTCGQAQDGSGDTTGKLRVGTTSLITDTNGTPAIPKRLLQPGTQLSDLYTVTNVIGEGGMGVVYLAHDKVRKRQVAIKVLHTNLMGDSDIRRRFLREARMMTEWSHPNIVAVYDLIEHNELLAFVMEYVDGLTLEEYLDKWSGQLPYEDIGLVFGGVLDGMQRAHDGGIVHRDLKPQNILLKPDDQGLNPKVVDFGIAKIIEGTQYTVTGALIGSCQFMSPEQAEGTAVLDHRSDIYSLGITLYYCVTGRCPFEGSNQFALILAHVRQAPIPPSQYRAKLPADLEELILDCLAKKPDDRPSSCAEFKERLAGALGNVTPTRRTTRSHTLEPTMPEPDGSELLLIAEGVARIGPSRRDVYLDAYYVARYPVTNRQFKEFLEVTKYKPTDEEAHRFLAHWRDGTYPHGLEDHPVVFVSWLDASAYCRWAGRRLPTEAEWEKAARGTKGTKYPWGKQEPNARLANFGRNVGKTTSVGSFPDGASPYGLHDMAGNVWEWCEDVDAPYFYLQGPDRNPRNTVAPKDQDIRRVVRGGSWVFDMRSLRTFARSSFNPTFRLDGVGFRCAYG